MYHGRRVVSIAGRHGRCRFSTSGGPRKASGGSLHEANAGVAAKSMSIGAGAGLLGSLVGLGGGFVAIPSLTGWLRLTQHQAHGTSLGAVLATGAAGSFAYALAGHVDYRAAGAMALSGMAAAHIGARSTAGMSPPTLKLALGVLMIAVAPLLPIRDKLLLERSPDLSVGDSEENVSVSASASERALPPAEDRELSYRSSLPVGSSSAETRYDRRRRQDTAVVAASDAPIVLQTSEGVSREGDGDEALSSPGFENLLRMSAIGLGSGFLAGVFGVGGGVVTVPAISLATDLGHKEVLGTSLAAMVLPAFVGSVTHFRQGNLLPRIALPLAIGTGVGAFVGGNYAARHIDEASLKWVFSFMMLVMGARTLSGARVASAAARRIKK